MSQRAIEIVKISDLKSVKQGEVFEWCIDYEEFQYRSVDGFLRSRTGVDSSWEIWPLTDNTKTAANCKVFKLIKRKDKMMMAFLNNVLLVICWLFIAISALYFGAAAFRLVFIGRRSPVSSPQKAAASPPFSVYLTKPLGVL